MREGDKKKTMQNAGKGHLTPPSQMCRTVPWECCHIGPLHCADCFHSWDRHTVPSRSDSQDPGNPGMPPASGRDNYVADAGPSVGRRKQMLWPT